MSQRKQEMLKAAEEYFDILDKLEEGKVSQKDVDELKDKLDELPEPQMVRQIGRSPEGFFSIWVEVFKAYPEVKKAILETVPGTAMECYDENYNPVNNINRT
jgi:hypothetical protein